VGGASGEPAGVRPPRWYAWPIRRVLDPRFGGLATQIDEKHLDVARRLDLIERELAALRSDMLNLNHERREELLHLDRERHEELAVLNRDHLAHTHAAIATHSDAAMRHFAQAELDGALAAARLVVDALRDVDRRCDEIGRALGELAAEQRRLAEQLPLPSRR
jgi:hypothetical protein